MIIQNAKIFYDKYEENCNLAVSKSYTNDAKLCNPLEKFVHFYKVNRSYKLHACSREELPELRKYVTSKSSEGMNFIDKLAYYLYQLSSKKPKRHFLLCQIQSYITIILKITHF
ncbi:hypothetical protein POVCU1_064510 [Plasmodium ovale curtisi]|uniref:PIR Superfamily Protein n=1 Tax=Plasmodium ovale curtisi TaxID=864141 RepID=A0A1A8XB68_PLAOA|nr:hypothetical protein POVCU1_064510 [Plasmodium ovale curtisi]